MTIAALGMALGVALVACDSDASGSSHEHAGHGSAAAEEVHGDGLSDSHDGYRMVAEQVPEERGEDVPVAFAILDEAGEPQTEYEVNRSKLLHMLVVRDDMHAFQHVHPELDGDTWRTTVDVPDGGQYRIFAEFVPAGVADPHPILLGMPFIVEGDTEHVPLPEPADEVEVDGLLVTRTDGVLQPPIRETATLVFEIAGADGAPVELEKYLDADAHVSAFNAMTMATTHLHPMRTGDGELTLHAEFEQRGEHRLFIEFQVDGEVHVAAFTLFAT